ncbi:serine/threonine-protein kinase [Kitasatospora sp. NPDC059817]|uniref:serine/threonine-protein kinase n=1 Tax=Kitasatospora sp. NPDC059817 TaxID=3346961 RepID=UPI00364D1C05
MWSDGRLLGGRYELRQRLGCGAMGEVWLGHDHQSQQSVAVKLVHRELLDPRHPEEMVQRFTREAGLLAQLKHPGIPAFLNARVGPSVDEPYLVMDYVLGQDLAEVIRERNYLPEQEVVEIAVQICDVLECTHAFPIIHRDLKPANIMLTSRQRVMVLDFGVARMFGTNQARLTMGNRVLGTVAYMPPEQCEGREVNPRSDLYSLACVLYELLTGTPPFTGDDAARVMFKHRHQPPNPVSLLRPDVDPMLEQAIMAGLAKQASSRPASAQEFRQMLGTSGTPGATVPAPSARVSLMADTIPSMVGLLPIHVRTTQAQALFDEGLIVDALPRFAGLADELAALGPERAEEAARCRFRHGCCLAHLGHHEEALKHLVALLEDLQTCRLAGDRLFLEVRFHVGQLRLDLGDQHGISELAEVYQALKTANRSADTEFTAEVSRALIRATLG